MEPLFADALAYDRIARVQEAWGKAVVADAAHHRLGVAVKVLADLGCGTGRVTALAAREFQPEVVICQDVSPAMVDQAAARLASLVPRVHTSVGDACAFVSPVPCELVFSNAAIHWMPDHDALARHVHAALSPGGMFRAQCGGAGNLRRAQGLAEKVWSEVFDQSPPPYPARFPSHDEWHRRLQTNGFEQVHTALTAAPTPFPDEGAFRDFVEQTTLLPILKATPEGGQGVFLDAYVARAARDLHLTLDYMRLDLRGVRRC
jgi:trans-aconitate 2-methyltransferase